MSYTCYNCFQEKPNNDVCPFCGYEPEQGKKKYPLALPEGTILGGRYIVGRVLGEGGFGITYVAQEYATKRLVAIKEYLPGEMATRTASNEVTAFSEQRLDDYAYGKARFLEEAKTLAEFQKEDHIVSIYSFFEENNTAYFAMEYVDGINLQQYMREHGGRLTPDEAGRLLRPVMEAVGKIHRKGIVHRDISPDNILITEDGEAKLIDFGAARYSIGQKSMSLDVVLKHGFAPIEQYSRRGKQGPFTDVYAMAATYYYAITGKLPPDAIDRIKDDPLQLPHSLGIKIKKSQENALKKGLAVNAEDRFQSMHEFADALCPEVAKKEKSQQKEAPKKEPKQKVEKPVKEKEGTPKKRKSPIPAIVIAALCLAIVVLAVKVILPEIKVVMLRNQLKQAEAGSIVTFGRYEQDNKSFNGKETIEWIVLDVQEDKALLVSRYALDCRQYNSSDTAVTWENCTLRTWLNEAFVKEAFSGKEQKMIPTSMVNYPGTSYGADYGKDTRDQVFLLSNREAAHYFSSNEERQCIPTSYTISQGCKIEENVDNCGWWLRSPGHIGVYASFVEIEGNVNSKGEETTTDGIAVRPALWVSLQTEEPSDGSELETGSDDSAVQLDIKELQEASVGDYVLFGTYEQDNDSSNGGEDIEWLVLDIQDNKALLLSRYALDCAKYNTEYNFNDAIWETCSLRNWLNNGFISTAFNSDEQSLIPAVTVNSDENSSDGQNAGNATQDKVFLLSSTEVDNYLPSSEERKCAPTEYAIKQYGNKKGVETDDAFKVDGKATCQWWLRSSGIHGGAVIVDYGGSILYGGTKADYGHAVRPALWIDLEAAATLRSATASELAGNSGDSTLLHEVKDLKEASVGDYVLFGNYEQDNDLTNGKEPIEWLVLDIQDNSALMISRYALDCQQFNSFSAYVTWSSCTLRTWLNGAFLDDAFSAEEQVMIPMVTVNADENPSYNTNPGSATKDQVFLLSIKEADTYFDTDSERQTAPTEYAVSHGAHKLDLEDKVSCGWWLRSPGIYSHHAAGIGSYGSIGLSGTDIGNSLAVRPALWVDLEAAGTEKTTTASKILDDNIDSVSQHGIKELKEASVGDYVLFGNYEQDNDLTNGKEAIEWIVLAKENDDLLLISQYALDCQQYHKRDTNITWVECTLRTWLNANFLNAAFSSDEQALIPKATVSADNNPDYGTFPGNNTQDQIFLLSVTEANKYFSSNITRQCEPTEYAKAQRCYADPDKGNCWWWLRAPGGNSNRAAGIDNVGSVNTFGYLVYYDSHAVRPALWIDLNKVG